MFNGIRSTSRYETAVWLNNLKNYVEKQNQSTAPPTTVYANVHQQISDLYAEIHDLKLAIQSLKNELAITKENQQ